jgi:hypothetical protein
MFFNGPLSDFHHLFPISIVSRKLGNPTNPDRFVIACHEDGVPEQPVANASTSILVVSKLITAGCDADNQVLQLPIVCINK